MKGRGSFLPLEKLLTDHEIVNLVRAFVGLGVHKLRLTGGEPLIRPGFPALITQLSEIPGLNGIAMTTNGVMLTRLAEDLAEAGLTRITVSLDTLDQDILDTLSGGKARLDEVMAGIAAAEAAEAADDAPRALIIAAPRCCTTGMKWSRYHSWSTWSEAPINRCSVIARISVATSARSGVEMPRNNNIDSARYLVTQNLLLVVTASLLPT